MWAKILLLFFVFAFLFRTDQSFDQDLGRHLKLGEIITKTHSVPKTNLFSYTNPDFPFINSHWLFELLIYLGKQIIGLNGLLIAKILILLFSLYLVFSTVKSKYLLLLLGYLFLHTFRERVELRPEVLSFLFTALTVFILNSYEKKKNKWVYLLPFIQLIWVNSHIYFPIGIITQGIFLIHGFVKKDFKAVRCLFLVIVFSVVFSFLNPSGLKGVLNPFTFTQNYGYSIVENQTMFYLESIGFKDPNFLFVKLAIGIIAFSLVVTIIRRVLDVKNILLVLAGTILALMNVRSFPFLVLLSLPAAIQNLDFLRQNIFIKILSFIIIPILLFESFSYLSGEYYRQRDIQFEVGLKLSESGKAAMDFVLKNDLPTPIFNNFDIGSYITYRGYPKYRIFVDGRPGEYPKEFFQNIYIPIQYDYLKFKQAEKQFGFKTVIFSHPDQTPWAANFLQSILKDNSWKIVFIDDFIVILVKEEVVATKQLKIIDLAQLTPQNYQFDNHVSYLRLGYFLIKNGYLAAGKKFVEKAYSIYPNSPNAKTALGI